MRLRELRVSYSAHPAGLQVDPRQRITCARDAAAILIPLFDGAAEEYARILLLDSQHHLLAVHELSHGGLDQTIIEPGPIFRSALVCKPAPAAALILAHNHPSGDPTPSPQDIEVTRRIVAAGILLGIPLLDHLIIGDDTFCSLKETGRL